jgi:hypothetical protein
MNVGSRIHTYIHTHVQDASRLVDLCRQCIVFEHFADLLLCLEAITHDPDIVVERIVNRLEPSYDSSKSAGYRDIKVM